MSVTSLLIVAGLMALESTPATSTSVEGIWELTGIGAPHDFSEPGRVLLAFGPAGEVRAYAWSRGDFVPHEATGRYTMRGDELRVAIPVRDVPEVWRVAWDGPMLVLRAAEEPDFPLFFFERRPWISP